MYQQIDYLTNKDLGFKGDQVIEINLNFPNSDYEVENVAKNIYNKYSTKKQELAKIKGRTSFYRIDFT
jgi:putative ABC transport system permease protein